MNKFVFLLLFAQLFLFHAAEDVHDASHQDEPWLSMFKPSQHGALPQDSKSSSNVEPFYNYVFEENAQLNENIGHKESMTANVNQPSKIAFANTIRVADRFTSVENKYFHGDEHSASQSERILSVPYVALRLRHENSNNDVRQTEGYKSNHKYTENKYNEQKYSSESHGYIKFDNESGQKVGFNKGYTKANESKYHHEYDYDHNHKHNHSKGHPHNHNKQSSTKRGHDQDYHRNHGIKHQNHNQDSQMNHGIAHQGYIHGVFRDDYENSVYENSLSPSHGSHGLLYDYGVGHLRGVPGYESVAAGLGGLHGLERHGYDLTGRYNGLTGFGGVKDFSYSSLGPYNNGWRGGSRNVRYTTRRYTPRILGLWPRSFGGLRLGYRRSNRSHGGWRSMLGLPFYNIGHRYWK